MTDADVKLLIDTLSAAVAAGQKVSVPAERVLELHARLLVAQMEVGEVERAARAAEREALIAEADATVNKLRALHKHTMGYEDACVARGAELVADALRARAESGGER